MSDRTDPHRESVRESVHELLTRWTRPLRPGGNYRSPAEGDETPVIELEDITKRFGPILALDGVDCQFERGRVHGVVGPNGSGKTTLFEIVLRLRRPTVGTVIAPPPREMGYSFQQPQFYGTLTVRENLRVFSRLNAPLDAEWLKTLTGDLGLDRVAQRPAGELSGGFQQKLDLALAFLSRPDVVILDEPLADVDELSRGRILELIADYSDCGGTVLVSSHNHELLDPVVDNAVELHKGTVVTE